MSTIVTYFENIPSVHRTLFLVIGLTFFYLLEYCIPLFHFKYQKWQHAKVNLFFTLTTIAINFVLAFILVKSSDYVHEKQIGLLYLIHLPLWVFMVLGILLLDLIGAYLVHFLQHQVRWMWQFHLVHHTDQEVDTTSANRHHPGESVFRFVFTTMAVFVSGTPIWLVMLYQSLSLVMSQFNHANIILPIWMEKSLSWLICTPNIHRVHHHYKQPYTDSNYGNIFSIWDRLFGTLKMAQQNLLVYGLDTHLHKKENEHVLTLLKMPFEPYRTPIVYQNEERL